MGEAVTCPPGALGSPVVLQLRRCLTWLVPAQMACKALGFHPLTWEMERRLRAGMVAYPLWTEELGRLIQASSIIDADEAQALVSMCRKTMCV